MKLDQQTLVPFSLLGIVLSVSVGGAWWASALYLRVGLIESKQAMGEQKYEDLVKEIRTVNETLVEIKTVLKGKQNGR